MEKQIIRQVVTGTKKLPKCVGIYNKLFQLINDDLKEGDKLPSENELSEIMNVSRTTLRQALTLLQEDGLIKNVRGVGNFVIKNKVEENKGLESLDNPIHSALNFQVDEIEIDFKLDIPSEHVCKVLESKPSAIVYVDRWYKNQGKPLAYTLSFIPIETIVEEKIDLSDKNSLKNFLEKISYEKSKRSSLKINISSSGNFSSMKYNIFQNNKSFLLEEKIYFKNSFPAIYNKHYLSIENSNILIERKK